MGTPHIHAPLIKAWADGAKIQENMYCGTTNPNKCWVDIGKNNQTILWCPKAEYRVKPEPDSILLRRIEILSKDGEKKPVSFNSSDPNVKYIFDGETNQLKSVEMIKHE